MTTVKFIHSAMTGAPVITNVAGTLISTLDACLVNGFGTGTLDSLVVANNLATATRSAGHPFELGTIVEIAGATPSGLNGQKRVLSTTTTTYTFDATGVSGQTATGTITGKVASLGWEKTYSGTNLAVYRSPTGVRPYLRVDDTGTSTARVVGYESMTDISTGTNPFPTTAQQTGGGFWDKNDGTTQRPWVVVGDSQAFYFYTVPNGGNAAQRTHFFGEFISNKANDLYDVALSAGVSTLLSSAESSTYGIGNLTRNNASAFWAARNSIGVVGSSILCKYIASLAKDYLSSTTASTSGLVYPNTPDNALIILPVLLNDFTPFSFRGKLPGVYVADQNISGVFTHREYLEGVSTLPGRTLRALATPVGSTLFFDTTGPWR